MGSSSYDVVLAVHVVGAIAWIGSLLAFVVLGTRVRAREDHEAAAAFAGRWSKLTRMIALPSSIATLLAGGWLMQEADLDIDATTWWLGAGIGMWIVAFLGSTMLRGGALARVVASAAEHGADDEDPRWRLRQILMVARGELLLLVAALAVMLIQPGS